MSNDLLVAQVARLMNGIRVVLVAHLVTTVRNVMRQPETPIDLAVLMASYLEYSTQESDLP